MTNRQRQIFTYLSLAYCIGLFFLPVRYDHVEGFMEMIDGKSVLHADPHVFSSSIIHFAGHPAGRVSLGLFTLMPFWFMLESSKFMRPLHIWSHLFLRLQGLLLILGGPYLYYVLTFEYIGFDEVKHWSEVTLGGYFIIAQTVLMGVFLFMLIAAPKSKMAEFFLPLRTEPSEPLPPPRREGW